MDIVWPLRQRCSRCILCSDPPTTCRWRVYLINQSTELLDLIPIGQVVAQKFEIVASTPNATKKACFQIPKLAVSPLFRKSVEIHSTEGFQLAVRKYIQRQDESYCSAEEQGLGQTLDCQKVVLVSDFAGTEHHSDHYRQGTSQSLQSYVQRV